MSSEGSVTTSNSSKIRQFGLYRTIDARTEEFLRLSRKRQIKQGCACAAVSTAITVTVVVSVLLVYEYSINGNEIDKSLTLKPSWLTLLNDSADNKALDAKFAKAKINVDRATLKLLPIILKALNQNRYLEKIIEDYGSSSPNYETGDATEYSVDKNIFTNRNVAKMPMSRLYTLEYKTSPVGHFSKRPANNLDFYSKIRQIRGHQNSFKNFNKMLNEKTRLSSQIPVSTTQITPLKKKNKLGKKMEMKKNEKKPNKMEHLNTSDLNATKHDAKKNETPKQDVAKQDSHCNCPKNLSYLLKKMVTSIQQLTTDKHKSRGTPCEDHEHGNKDDPMPFTFYSLKPSQHIKSSSTVSTTTENSPPTTDPPTLITKSKNSSDLFKEPNINDFFVKYIIPVLQRSLTSQKLRKPQVLKGYPLVNSIHKKDFGRYINYDTNLKDEPTPFTELVIPATDSEGHSLKTTTMPMTLTRQAEHVSKTTTEKYKFWEGDHEHYYAKKALIETYFEEDEDYTVTETTMKPSLQEELNKLGAHSMQLVKTRMILPDRSRLDKNKIKSKVLKKLRKNLIGTETNTLMKNTTYNTPKILAHNKPIPVAHNTLILCSQKAPLSLTDKIAISHTQNTPTPVSDNTPNSVIRSAPISFTKNAHISLRPHRNSSYTSLKKMLTEVYTTRQQGNVAIPPRNIYENIKGVKPKTKTQSNQDKGNTEYEPVDKFLQDDDVDKIIPDEELLEAEPTRKNNSMNQGNEFLSDPKPYDIQSLNKYTSMVPVHRPLYLDIRRSDGRHDDTPEFDLNINNNIFDYTAE